MSAKRLSVSRAGLLSTAFLIIAFLSAGSALAETVTFTSSGAVTINDNTSFPTPTAASPYPSAITVSVRPNAIVLKAEVTLNGFTHPRPNSVDVALIAPGPVSDTRGSLVMSNVGGTSAVSNVNLIIGAESNPAIPIAGPLVSGTYRPTDDDPGSVEAMPSPAGSIPQNPMTTFENINPNGQWKLFVSQDFPTGSSGSITSWSITLTLGDQFTNASAVTFNDPASAGTVAAATPYPSSISVSGLSGTVSQVRVTIDTIQHSATDDLDMMLVGPGGQKVMLWSDVGNTSICGVCVVKFWLYDSATLTLPDSALSLSSSNAKPADWDTTPGDLDTFPAPAPAAATTALLSTFNGTSPNGTWSLYIVDDTFNGSTGAIFAGWSVTIETSSAPVTVNTTTTLVSNDADNSVPSNTNVTFTAHVTRNDTSANITSGTITFKDGATTLGTGTLDGSGNATFATSTLTVGAHTISASYPGVAGSPILNPSSAILSFTVVEQTLQTGATSFCANTYISTPTAPGGLGGDDGDTALAPHSDSFAPAPNAATGTAPPTPAIPYPAHLVVSGLTGQVIGMTVTLRNVNHHAPDDADVMLVAPTGAKTLLMSDAGGTPAAFNANLTFSDAGPPMPDETSIADPVSASYPNFTWHPTNYGTTDVFPGGAPAAPTTAALSTFNGLNPNGTWELYIVDDHAGDHTAGVTPGSDGTIDNGWCVTFQLNQAPVAADDTLTVAEDGSNSVNVLANDVDADAGQTLTVTTLTPAAAHGTVGCTAAGICTYTPTANYFGTDSFSYSISDGFGGTSSASVSVTVTPVPDAPDAVDDPETINEDAGPTSFSVLANDTDADGDTLSITTPAPAASNGTVSCTTTNCTYTPNANYFGSDSFTYSISDGNSGTDSATVSITINAVNDPPVAVNDAISTSEDNPGSVNVLTNDSDVELSALSVTTNTNGANGSANCTALGVCTYTPNANFFGSDSFTYTVSDGTDTSIGTVNVTVSSVNDNPVANDDVITANEDTSGSVNVVTNDTDVDLDTLTVTGNTNGANGSVVCTTTTCTYTPNANYFGPDSFTYTISDGQGGTDTATVNVTINSVNDPPVAVNDAISTSEDNPGSVNVLTNDSDVELSALSVTTNTNGANGTANCTALGVCTYTPNANFFGSDSFTYTVSDGTDTSIGTVNVTVSSVNDNPVANDDVITANEDTSGSVNVVTNDTDVDLDTLTVTGNTNGANGSVVCTTTTCTYTPNANYFGPDSFTYTISDGQGGTDTATVNVTINSVNDPPVAVNDSISTSEDNPGSVNVLTNDSDVELSALSVTTNTNGANGSANCTALGVCTYTPNANFFGSDSFTYTVSDGTDTSIGTVNVTVSSVNDNPVANDDVITANEDTSGSVNVVTNDTDVDLDTLTVTGNTNGTNGSVVCTTTTCTYTPNANFFGSDSFTYTISDGNGGTDTATVNVTINAVNDPPVAVNDAISTSEDNPGSVNVLTNDSDVELSALSVTTNTNGANGTANCTALGVCTYTPNANFFGSDSFTYTVSDGTDTSVGTVNVTVSSVNDNPVANDDVITANEDTSGSVNVVTNDTDVDLDTLTVTGNTNGANGSVVCTTTTCTYTPNANFNGGDSFTYTISDGNSGTDTATVNVTINAVNDPPVAVNDAISTSEDNPGSVNVLTNDSDVELSALSVTTNTNGANGTANCTVLGVCTYTPNANFFGSDSFTYTVSDGTDTAVGTVNVTVSSVNDNPVANDDAITTNEDTPGSVNVVTNDTDVDLDTLTVTGNTNGANGSVVCTTTTCTYTPNANFNGSDSFTYTIGDGNSGTDTATVNVTINAVNDPPVAVNDAITTSEDNPGSVNVLTNDSDVELSALSVTTNTNGANGTANCTALGVCTYTPNADFFGSDSFTYTVSDGTDTSVGTVNVTVSAVNDNPVANDDAITTNEDTPGSVNVVTNDTDVDLDTLTVTGNTNGANGSVVCTTTTCTYTPNANFNGSDSFTYTISDGHGGTDTATVNVTINAVNDNPVANTDTATTAEETAVIVNVLTNDTDPDADALSVTGKTNGAHGTVVCSTTSCTYTPALNYNGPDSFTYTIGDGHGGTAIGTVNVTVTPVNDAPVANPDAYSTTQDNELAVPAPGVFANDIDADGDALTLIIVTPPTGGTLTPGSGGAFLYQPFAGFAGSDSFTYRASDGSVSSNIATVTIDVAAVSAAPTALVTGSQAICRNTSATISAFLTGSAPWTIVWSDGFSQQSAASVVTRVVSPSATTTYTITSLSDSTGSGTAAGSATITLIETPAPPTISGPTVFVLGQPMTLSATPGSAHYQWFLDGTPIAGAVTSSYSVSALTPNDLGTYTVIAYDDPCASSPSPSFVVSLSRDAILAVVGSVRGSFGSNFQSVLHLFHDGPGTATGELRVILSDGRVLTIPYSIPAHTRQTLADFLPADYNGLGTITIVPAATSGVPSIIAQIFSDSGADGTSGMTEGAIPLTQALTTGMSAVLIAPEDPGRSRFNIGLRSLEQGAAVHVVVRDAQGATRTTADRTIPPNTLVQLPVADLIGGPIGANDSLTFRITSGRVVIYGTSTDNVTNDPNIQFAQPVAPATAATASVVRLSAESTTTYYIPVSGSTAGAFGSRFRTGVQLANPSESAMSGRFVFHPMSSSAAPGDPELAFTVPPRGVFSSTDVVAAMAQSGLGSLDVIVTSSVQPVVVVRVFNDGGDAGQTSVTQSLLRRGDAIAAGEHATILAPRDPARQRFNIGFRTLGDGAAVSVTIRSAGGEILKTAHMDLAPDFFVHTGAAALLQHTFTGSESVTWDVVRGALFVYGVWTDNVTQDPSLHFAMKP